MIEHMERRDLDLTGIASVEVAAFNGDVAVETGDETPRLEAILTGAATYEVERLGTLLYIAGKKRGQHYTGSAVSFRLWLPAGLALKLGNINGAMTVHGAVRSLDATTHTGSIETVRTGPGTLRLRTSKGGVTVRGADGRIEINAIKGEVALADATATVRISTIHGDAQVARLVGALHLTTVHGAVSIADFTGQLWVSTSNRNATLERITLTPDTQNAILASQGAVMVRDLRAPGGLALMATSHRPISAALTAYTISSNNANKLKAELPGPHPAHLKISTTGEVRIEA